MMLVCYHAIQTYACSCPSILAYQNDSVRIVWKCSEISFQYKFVADLNRICIYTLCECHTTVYNVYVYCNVLIEISLLSGLICFVLVHFSNYNNWACRIVCNINTKCCIYAQRALNGDVNVMWNNIKFDFISFYTCFRFSIVPL